VDKTFADVFDLGIDGLARQFVEHASRQPLLHGQSPDAALSPAASTVLAGLVREHGASLVLKGDKGAAFNGAKLGKLLSLDGGRGYTHRRTCRSTTARPRRAWGR
jgi:hypothetical protein